MARRPEEDKEAMTPVERTAAAFRKVQERLDAALAISAGPSATPKAE